MISKINSRSSFGKCIICGANSKLKTVKFPYIRCSNCHHEYNISRRMDDHIINDILDIDSISRNSAVDRFKSHVLKKSMCDNALLIDIGSASGRFIYKNKDLFRKSIGVEVAKESLDFSRKVLNLDVRQSLKLDKRDGKISVVSFWHTLEHIKIQDISPIMHRIKAASCDKTRLIISVPNSDSLMYALFRDSWAFFDKASHHHQFSRLSLDVLMKKFGFVPEKNFYSLTYTVFGYMQSLLNKFNKIHNFMYYYKKRGQGFSMSKIGLFFMFLYNMLLSALFLIPALILSIYDLIFTDRRGVLTITYKLP